MTRNNRNEIKILIVEDELLVAEQIALYLKNNNYRIVGIVDNGEEVVEFLKHDSPDLILMDIELNGKMDGIQTAAVVQESLYIPIIYLSKKRDEYTLNQVKTTLPIAYLSKPFKNHDLRFAIEMAIYKGDTEHQKNAQHEIKLNLDLDIQNHDGIKHLQNRIFYKETNGGLRKLMLNEIVFLKEESAIIKAHTINGVFEMHSNLDRFINQIKNASLIRIHKQYVINLIYINQIFDQEVALEFENTNPEGLEKIEQLKLPISAAYKKDFFDFINGQVI